MTDATDTAGATDSVGPIDPVDGVGAVVLTGGRGSRLGGLDKARLRVAGQPMVETVLRAAREVASPVVTVGPGGDTREEPPHSGPVAGIAAGLAALPETVRIVVVVACDLPGLDADTLRALVAAARESGAGQGLGLDRPAAGGRAAAALGLDAAGHDQYLLAAWDRRALATRLAELRGSGGVGGLPVRALYRDRVLARVPVGEQAGDVDTWADLARRGPVAAAHVGAVLASAIPLVAPAVRPPFDAVGGVLAEALVAAAPMPLGPVSAMDGYALAGTGPWRLTGAPLRAGGAPAERLRPGTAAPIATGALAPPGTDRVLRHELVEVSSGGGRTSGAAAAPGPGGGAVLTASPQAEGVDDLRPVGEDWAAGHHLAEAGTTLDAALASAALSAGATGVAVRGPVRARLVTTGDEVLPADSPSPLPRGRIRDTVGPVLGGVLARAGFAPAGPPGHCPDTAEAVADLLRGAPDADPGADPGAGHRPTPTEVLVLVGATGRGVADHLRPALARAGARVVLDGVRVRPGGSQLVAVLPDGRVLLGLPGNPLAAVCAAATTGRALVDALTGRARQPALDRVEGVDRVANPGRARILPARPGAAGGWVLTPNVRTAHLADLAGSPALAVVPEGAAPDDRVEIVAWI